MEETLGFNPNAKLEKYGIDPTRKLSASKQLLGFVGNISQVVRDNTFFRCVIYTSLHEQMVAMNIEAGDQLGYEVHPENDQTFLIVEGTGKVDIDGSSQYLPVKPGDIIVVPAGNKHNVMADQLNLKVLTIYSPPHHPYDRIQETHQDALEENKY